MSEDANSALFEALGRMVAGVRSLEGTLYAVARASGVFDPEQYSADRALTATRRSAREGLPPWVNVSGASDRVATWCRDVKPVFKQRNKIVHWRHAMVKRPEGWAEWRENPRLRAETERADSIEAVLELTERAEALGRSGTQMQHSMMLCVREGLYFYHPALTWPERPVLHIVWDPQGRWPVEARPTPEEQERWLVDLVAHGEWDDWITERVLPQVIRHPRYREMCLPWA
jgi:hypothetical protein